MNRTKRLRGPCEHCGVSLEYLADMIGSQTQCPHCGKMTHLLLETPPDESGLPKRVVVWTAIALIILIGGLAAAFYALNKTKAFVRERKAMPGQTVTNSASPL